MNSPSNDKPLHEIFSLREKDNPLQRFVHPRIPGVPPQQEGPLAGVTRNVEAQAYWNLGALDWDMVTTRPSLERLEKLGITDIAGELWPPEQRPGYIGPNVD